MSVLAPGVRDRSFRTVFRGYDPASVRAALDAAVTAFEALEADVTRLKEQHVDALREIDRMGELERSLLRSCVAAEEDARVRCGAARRYATRVIAAAQEQAAASLEAPTRERDRIARDIEAMVECRRQAAAALEAVIEGLQRVPEPESEPLPADAGNVVESPAVALTGAPFDEDAASAIAVEESPDAAGPVVEPHLSAAEPMGGSVAPQVTAVPPNAVSRPGDQPPAQATGSPGGRRGRVPLVACAAAALLLILHGAPAVPRVSTTPPAVAAASFAPLPAEAPVPVPRDQEGTASTASSGTRPDARAAAGLTIHIKPLRTCWVRVVVDGHTDARELQPGEDIVLNAHRSIVLRAGDAGALSIEVNGRVLPPLGLDGQVVERRFTAAAAE
jgi:cell division initiation protein